MTIGVEIGPKALLGVSLRRRLSGFSVQAKAETRLAKLCRGDALPEDGVLEASLAGLDGQISLRGQRLAVAIPSRWCKFRVLSYPYQSKRRVYETLKFTAEALLPGKVESYVVEPIGLMRRRASGGSTILTASCDKSYLDDVLEAFREAGAEAVLVQPALLSMVSLFHELSASKVEREVLLVRVLPEDIEIALVSEGVLAAAACVRRAAAVRDASDAVGRDARSICSVLANMRMGGYGGALSQVVLWDENEEQSALADELKDHLRADVVRGQEALGGDGRLVDGPYVAAAGCACSLMRGAECAPNLRREEYAYRPFATRHERRIGLALLLCAAIVAANGVGAVRSLMASRSSAAALVQQQEEFFREVLPTAKGRPSLEVLGAAVRRMQKSVDSSKAQGMVTCLRRWYDLVKAAPPEMGIVFELIDIDQQRISLRGSAPTSARVLEMRQRLKTSGQFVGDAPVTTEAKHGTTVSYTMELRYNR